MKTIFRPKFIIVTVISLASLFSQIIIPWQNKANAESDEKAWSWSTTKPTVASSTEITDMAANQCSTSYSTQEIVGESEPKRICLMSNHYVKFGIYNLGGYYQATVGFPFDNKMYRINGACSQYDDCLYLPDKDILVTKRNLINGYVRSLVVYTNFTHRLTKFFNIQNRTLEYNFDGSNPNFIFQSSGNYAWPIGGIGASNNGKWLAVEFRQRGIGLLDMDSLQMKRISTMALYYNYGRDPISELAVSNDGHTVALMGMNVGLTIFDTSSDCGVVATDNEMEPGITDKKPCKISPIDTEDFIHRFSQAFHPKFNDDGGELNFYATSYDNVLREVSLRAAGYSSQRLDYLALGDSFSSGEGESFDGYYLDGTNIEFEKCHLSTRSYPYLIAHLSNIDPAYMRSVACSGATTLDVIGNDSIYMGQGNRLGKDNLNLIATDRILAQTEAKISFMPGRIRQNIFTEEYQPQVITVGIGGNDAGFMQKLQSCLGPDTCDWATDPQKKEQTANEIKGLFNTLVNTYQTIHDSSPRSKIYAIGYPKIIDEAGQCSPLIGYLLNSTERRFMNEGIIYMNQIIAAAAQKVGIKYLNIQDSFGDHVLCGKSGSIAMNSIRTGDDNALIDKLDWFKFIGQESFHPNALGHYYESQTIFSSIGDILSYNNCKNGDIVCPIDTVAPGPSNYWIPDINHNYPMQKSIEFMFDRKDNFDNRQKQISLPDLSLAPDSSVNIEIMSTPQSLGLFQANSEGSLNVELDLPINLEEGYHTVHIYGTSYSNELIDLYQVIEYRKPPVKITENIIQTIVKNDLVSEKIITEQTPKLEIAKNDSVTDKTSTVSSINKTSSKENNAQFGIPEVKGDSIILNKNLLNKTSSIKQEDTKITDQKMYFILFIIGTILLLSVAINNIRKAKV